MSLIVTSNNKRYIPLLVLALLAIIIAVLFYFRMNHFSLPSSFGVNRKTLTAAEFENILQPLPAAINIKNDTNQKIDGHIIKVKSNVPHSGIAMADDDIIYASGLQEKNKDTYFYSIYLLENLPKGIAEKDIVRYIFLNLYFDSFASDHYANPENRRSAFQEWMRQQKNYDEIDAMITKMMSQQ